MTYRLPLLFATVVVVVVIAAAVECSDLTEAEDSKVDSHVTPSEEGYDSEKRGNIFRYGRSNVFRYGKRAPSVFRYGKRAPSVFRYGKRDDEDFDAVPVETLFPKRVFRYGKRALEEAATDNFTWVPQEEALLLGKREVFRYGKRGEVFGGDAGEEEDDDGKVLSEKSHKAAGEALKDKDEKRSVFRYGRSARMPKIPFRFGDE